MKINISINGILRNFLQKYEYHYKDYYLSYDENEDNENGENSFKYSINRPIRTIDDFIFQSKDEQDVFTYMEFPLEIFGYAGLNSPSSVSEINKLIFEQKNIEFTLVGLDEYGKAKPSTLFFLSKNGFLGNNIKFITTDNIKKEWKKCDIWITDDEEILKNCPLNKTGYKFNTTYNTFFKYENEINNIKQIEEICLKYSEKTTTLIWMSSMKNVVLKIARSLILKMKMMKKPLTQNQ